MTQPIPRISAKPAPQTPAEKRRARWKTLVVLVMVVGAILLSIFHDRYVFHYADAYMTLTIGALILFTPIVLYWIASTPVTVKALSEKYPTNGLRNVIVMPLMAAMGVGMFCAAPLGWLFAVAAWSGGAVHHVRATAIEVGTYSKRKNCDQTATLRFASFDKETCLEGLYPLSLMREGQALDVGIKEFSFGFLIVSIANANPAVPDVPAHDAASTH